MAASPDARDTPGGALVSVHVVPATSSTIVVAIDVGKNVAAISATDSSRRRVLPPTHVALTRSGLDSVVTRIQSASDPSIQVRVGVEAAGHYHQPVLGYTWPSGWELVEVNPARVAEQRKIFGRRRVKTDAIDLDALTVLLLAGQGIPVISRSDVCAELSAWSAHRSRRVLTHTATMIQLTTQLDRAFPGVGTVISDLFGTGIGRLVIAEFTDPTHLTKLGTKGLIAFAADHGLRLEHPRAERLVAAAADALPTPHAALARQVIARDRILLADLEAQITVATARIAELIPASPFATLMSVPGWGPARIGNYAGALGDPERWAGPAQIYRASGLVPAQYESAGKRRDGHISREGSVPLRRALIELGFGLRHNEPAAKRYAADLKLRGKPNRVIGCALAHRANRIAYALVRDRAAFDPGYWRREES